MRTIYVDKNVPRMLAVKALRPIWNDVTYSPISAAHFSVVAEPTLPGGHWIRVKNRLCGICASDIMALNVDTSASSVLAAMPDGTRMYLGHEVVSDVVEVGPGVTQLQAGDRVIMHVRFQNAHCLGQEINPPCAACARGDYVLCENAWAQVGSRGAGGGWSDGYTAHETEVMKVPDHLSDEEAAMVEPLAVGLHTVLKCTPGAGDNVYVLGSGVVGLNVIQALRALAPECHITVAARHQQQAALAKAWGADEVLYGRGGSMAAARLTGARTYKGMMGAWMMFGGYDIVYNCVGSDRSLQDSLRWTKARGTVVLAGIKSRPLKLDLTPVWFQEVDLVGVNSHGLEQWQGRHVQTFDMAIQLLTEGKLTVEGLITHRFRLEHWKQAIHTAQDKSTGAVKVVFDYR